MLLPQNYRNNQEYSLRNRPTIGADIGRNAVGKNKDNLWTFTCICFLLNNDSTVKPFKSCKHSMKLFEIQSIDFK